MGVKFFGQFLVERNIVSRDALVQAIELQEKRNLKLGEMAVAMGLLTQSDIEKAHAIQMSRDIRLGDLLVEAGMITLTQLQDILTRQKNTHLYIGEALVMVGAITESCLPRLLEEFKADQAQYVTDHIELPAGIPSAGLWEACADMTYKMITRVLGVQFRPEKCRVVTNIDSKFMMAAMDFSGDVPARYIISVTENLRKIIAKAVLKESSVDNEPEEVLDDTVMEFVNIVCGNIVAKASQMGIVLDINPPVTMRPPAEGVPVQDGMTALLFPIHVSTNDDMELLLLINNA